MSRSLTLEEYLEEFVDEHTDARGCDEVSLLVTDQEAQTLGYFLVNGFAGFVERSRLERRRCDNDRFLAADEETEQEEDDADLFIN